MTLPPGEYLPEDIAADPQRPRRFRAGGREWLVWCAGESTGGTGVCPPARLVSLQFAAVEAPDTPLFEILATRCRLDELFDEELAELLRAARPIPAESPPPPSRPPRPFPPEPLE